MAFDTRLFVSNLPDNLNEKDLVNAFSAYGEVTNLDIKSKNESDGNPKKFAFITLVANGYDVESCIKFFLNEEFGGNKLYVTRARESFLERLKREREQIKPKSPDKNTFVEHNNNINNSSPIIKFSEKSNSRKRQINHKSLNNVPALTKVNKNNNSNNKDDTTEELIQKDEKKDVSDRKRLQSMNKKRQEFKEKQNIIKSGLISIDKVGNKKIIFSDNVEQSTTKPIGGDGNLKVKEYQKSTVLFEDDDSDNDDITFEIKQQFEGREGKKVLDLQSRYKSDKRFTLDERFIEDDDAHTRASDDESKQNDVFHVSQADEKSKQLDILQDVLGIQIKQHIKDPNKENKKSKAKLGMLRFDPTQPEHAKFLIQTQYGEQNIGKKQKKNKAKKIDEKPIEATIVDKVEVSKEQFFKVSENLKEVITQPAEFSLRSLFSKRNDTVGETEPKNLDNDYVTQEPLAKTAKVKNPLAPGEHNPFVYDSSDSETEEAQNKAIVKIPNEIKVQAVWKENLFFSDFDVRLKEGLLFFNKSNQNEGRKERRDLKCLMKKRTHNTERKNQMFQRKIGGRRKSMKKCYMKHGMNKKNK